MAGVSIPLAIALRGVKVFDQFSDFPTTGNINKLYIDRANNSIFRWNGTNYIMLTGASGLTFRGVYDAQANDPDLTTVTQTIGDLYVVSVANDNIPPDRIDGITSLDIDDQLLVEPDGSGGTQFVRIPAINTARPPISIDTDTTLSQLNTTYLVDATNDVTITIPQATTDNRSLFFRIIKVAGTGNVTVVPDTGVVFLGDEQSILMRSIGDVITLQSTGESTTGWAIVQRSLLDILIQDVEFLSGTNTEPATNGNFRIIVENDQLLVQRYEDESSDFVTKGMFGDSVETDRFILQDQSGKLLYRDGTDELTLIQPLVGQGAVVGNALGSFAMLHNGTNQDFTAASSETTTVRQSGDTETTADQTSFRYDYVIPENIAQVSATFRFDNAPMGTRVRLVVFDIDNNKIDESTTAFEFAEGGGTAVVNGGDTTITLRAIFPFEENFRGYSILEFSEETDILGATLDLNDGLGNRFHPYFATTQYTFTSCANTNENNVVDQIEAQTGDDRLDYNALRNLPNVGGGSDTDAIHDNIAGEINAIAIKTSLADDDVFVIEDSADSFNKKRVRAEVITGTTPTNPSVHQFSITLPSRVDVGASPDPVNIQQTVTFSITNYSLITGIVLHVGSSEFPLTLPTIDGVQNQVVTLSGIDISTATTYNMFIELNDDSNLRSNTQVLTIANVQPHELLYWDIQTSSNAADFDYQSATAESQEILTNTNTITVQTFTGVRHLGIAQPSTEDDFTSITIDNFEQIGAFTKNAGAVTINSESYDVWLSNNALVGPIVSGDTIVLTR